MDDFFMDEDTAATTTNNDADGNNNDGDTGGDSGAIALGMDSGNNDDVFAGMDVPSNDAYGDANGDDTGGASNEAGDASANEEKGANDEPTFLSVWQEQRRIELQKRRDKEVEEQRKLQAQAEEDLNEFHANRQRKIEAKQKENRDKESGLRDDLNSVFQHGTLWEQVGRLVNLQEVKSNDEESVDRMRNLLIHLKNVKQK